MMKTEEEIKNDEINLQADDLTDLPVTDEMADTTRGGGIVRGGAGNDTLVGGDGRDVLVGGAGLDVLIGNTGGDRLID